MMDSDEVTMSAEPWGDEFRSVGERRTASSAGSAGADPAGLLFDLFPTALFTLTRTGEIRALNAHAAELFSVAPGALVGHRLGEFVFEPGRRDLQRFLDEVAASEGRVTGSCIFVRFSGAQFRARLSGRRAGQGELFVMLEDLEPELAPIERLAREMVARREAENELAGTRERLAGIVETAADAIVLFDERGSIEFANPSAARLFRYDAAELIGRDVRTVVELPEEGAAAAERAKGRSFSVEGVRRDGVRFPAQVTMSQMTVNHHQLCTAIVRDQTHVQSLEKKFIEAQRLEAAGALAAGLLHDFNNILMGINGSVALAERELEVDHPARRQVEEIRESVERAAGISRQLLAFTRGQPTSGRLFDVDAITVRLRNLVETTVGENVRLRFDLRASGLHVAGDRRHFEQAMLNLVINARHAMRDGGQLTIETRAVELEQPLHRYERTLPVGHYVKVTVRDTGEGIASEHLSRIFEPFFTTKELGQGTGLGLSMVYGTTRAMGGVIEVRSEVGQGTEFELLLPAIVGIDPSLEEPISTGEYVRIEARPRRVIVVEDDLLVARTVELYLQSNGHTTLHASSLAEAQALLEAHAHELDLLISDAVLPDAFGSDVARAAQEFCPAIGIIFMSAHPRSTLLDHQRILAGQAFLHKPFDPAELARAMHECERVAPRNAVRPAQKVMLVDDHGPSVAALEAVLSDAGFRVLTAVSCREARSVWRSESVDTLVVDMRLPDGAGATLAQEFLAEKPDLRVIYASGMPREASLAEYGLGPQTEYLEKPFDLDELCAMLES